MKGKPTNFERKLKSYSALATGVLAIAGAGTVQGQIVYTDVNPDRNLVTGDTMNIDFNHDGVIDFYIQMRDALPSGTQCNFYPNNPNTAQCLGTLVSYTNLGYADALAANAPINATNPHWNPGVSQWVFASVWGTTFYGHFGDGNEHYAGIYFQDGSGGKHFGWLRVTAITAAGTTCTVKDFAYETAVNTAINAGAGSVSVPEIDNSLKANIFSNDKKIHVRLNKTVNGTISVLNTLGQSVKSQEIINNNNVIEMSDFSSGIYIVNIQMGASKISRKVIL